MRLLGLEAIYRKPHTSVANPEHRVYPYLLRGLTIERPNQVWCADITYIPVPGGFLYLVAIMDWASRRVLAWRLSNTMDTEFCLAALAEALESYGIPEIFNTDQGSQFTSIAFIGLLETASHTGSGSTTSNDRTRRWPAARLRKRTVTGWRNVRRRWRSEQERQATGMECEGIRGRMGARAGGTSYPHIHRLVHPLPGPYPHYRRLISTRRGGLTTNGIHP